MSTSTLSIVNLNPHAIVLRNADGVDHEIPPSGTVARVSTTPGDLGHVAGIPVPVAEPTIYGEIVGLPSASEGTVYLVSAMVGAALRASGSDRTDVLCPGTGPQDGAVRYAKGHELAGQILAVIRLVRP